MTPDPALREQLLALAYKVANERGWAWREPVEVTSGSEGGEPVWIVRTNALARGTNVRVLLRRSDLAVVHAGYLPR